ncbi:hypothetical protein REB14_16650 [Chryseobacterium sp. ES2]|uniref:Lipoprotein n=1 Tax=Chryseobacterium metallicongregator TaxID=3073042 RepID=A0ABU1E7T8_9FLAO|nr:hypothetical protein [Chryseobacterium sp. ES2]MDR4953811.1 hypothetical protein [Chryseobacterium sp. ES2]
MKKKDFKPIMVFLFFLFALTSCASQELIYEPIGISDKPLPIFRITTKKHQDLNNDIYVVDRSTFSLLKDGVLNKKNENTNKSDNIFEYGSYKITYLDNSKRRTYIIDSKQKSYIFFQEQLEQVKSNEKLYDRIKVLLKRMN